MNENKKRLYDALSQDYDLGTFEQFSVDIDNEEKRKKLYNATSKDYDFGDFESFSKQLGYEKQAPAIETTKPIVGKPVEAGIPQAKETPAQIAPDSSFPMFGDEPNPSLYKNREDFLQQTNRQQVAELAPKIDSLLNEAQGRQIAKKVNDRKKAAAKGFWSNLSHALATSGGSPTGPAGGGIGHSEVPLDQEDLDIEKSITNLKVAQRAMTNAQRIIAEADHNAQEGSFGKWLERSFAGGAVRGFGQKTFDIENWDMGMSEMEDASTLYAALRAYDNGQKLTDEQQAMLDAKAVELATNAYFGSQVGRGYKAGKVTAESIPFMIEMCINPAASMGKSAQSQLTRYAIERFGKQAIKKNAGKLAAAKTVTRVAGDIAGAATMAATTGSVRTLADATERAAGHIQFDTDEDGQSAFVGHTEGDDVDTAFAKAFAGTTIENYSEMVGNYFAPVLGAVGKGVSKGLDKIGLGKVNQFIDDVSMSDFGKLVADFEKHSQWNGVIGEYAEEVVGNIMNSIVVGDMTFDAADGTGVFNLDQNIDTFLGVALLGGTISSAKTLGYVGGKYINKRKMNSADSAGSALFGEEEWKPIHDVLYAGTEEATPFLADIMTNPDITEDKKRAVLDYAAAVQKYKGAQKGDEKKHMENPNSVETDLETSFDNGYDLSEPQELNDAKNMYERQKDIIRLQFGLEDDADVDAHIGNPVAYIEKLIENGAHDNFIGWVMDYANAKATYEGMIQHVKDDIASRVEASNRQIDSHVHHDGFIHPATLTTDRKVYVVNGNIAMQEDGKTVDRSNADESIIIRDAETGKLEFASPYDFLSIDDAVDATQEKEAMRQQIMQTYAQEAANKIDGILPFNLGDVYNGIDEQGVPHTITIVTDVNGVHDNGDGTVNVIIDETPATLPKEQVQIMTNASNLARLSEYEKQKEAKKEAAIAQQNQPTKRIYEFNDQITIRNENGEPVRGQITAPFNEADGKYEVYTEQPINGNRVNLLTPEELDTIIVQHNGEDIEAAEPMSVKETSSTADKADEPQSAISRIPVNEHGDQIFEQAPIEDSWAALVEMNEGDEAEAIDTAQIMANNAKRELDKAMKQKPKGGSSVSEIQQAKAAQKANIKRLQEQVNYWNNVAGYKAAQEKAAEEEAKRQRNLRLAEARRIQQQKGRYSEEDKALGDYLDFRDYVMRTLARGGMKLKWSDDSNGVSKGLAGHLGFKGNQSEMAKRIWMLNNEEGMYPQAAAEALLQGYAETFGATDGYAEDVTNVSSMDALSELLDVVLTHGNSHRGMFEAAAERRKEIERDMDDYAEGIMQHNLEMEAEARGMTTDEWQSYLDSFSIYMQEADNMADEEFNSIFVELYQQQDYDNGRAGDGVRHTIHEGQRPENRDTDSSEMVHGEEPNYSGAVYQSAEEQEEPPIFEQSGFSHVPPTETIGEYEEIGNLPEAYEQQTHEHHAEKTAAAVGSDNDEQREADGTGVAHDSTGKVSRTGDRGDIRMFEEGLAAQHNDNSEYSERDRREAESKRLVSIAKRNGMFVPHEETRQFGEKHPKRTGESVVYIDSEAERVIKVKDPYAKSAMKAGVEAEDAIYEHIIHNLLFPETAYTFEGISEQFGEVRIILSQDLITTYGQPTKEQITEALAARGLQPETKYSFGNDLVSVTDVEGDNVLLGEDGTVYFIDPIIRFKKPVKQLIDLLSIAKARTEVNTNPTKAQKEAGNYRMGHVKIDGLDITIENPKGSIRRGTSKTGKKWETEMANDYGYIKGSQSIDGDHIDIFLSDNPTEGNVYVIDQINPDTQQFDEHKVMYGFNSAEKAEAAYLANYEKGWKGLGTITEVSKDEFKKWLESSHRKTKPFSEYKNIKATAGQNAGEDSNEHLSNLAEWHEGDIVKDYYTKVLYRIKKHSRNGVTTIAEIDFDGTEVSTKTMNSYKNRRYELVDTDQRTYTAPDKTDSERERGITLSQIQAAIRPVTNEIVKGITLKRRGELYDELMRTLPDDMIEAIMNVRGSIDVDATYAAKKEHERRLKEHHSVLKTDESVPEVVKSVPKTAVSVLNQGYSVEPAQYTTKKGKVLNMHLVKFDEALREGVKRVVKGYAKELKGWWDKEKGGFMMRSEEDAKKLADYALDAQAQEPVSMADLLSVTDGDVAFIQPKKAEEPTVNTEEKTPKWRYAVSVDRRSGHTAISREDVSGIYPIGDDHFNYSANTPEEMLDILRNPLNGMQDVLEEVEAALENRIKIREFDRIIREDGGFNGFKVGEKVMYQGKEVAIHDFEEYGDHRPVLDTGLAPILYVVGNWDEVSKIDTPPIKPKKVNVESLLGELKEKEEAKLSDHTEDKQAELVLSSFGQELTTKDGKQKIRIKQTDGTKRTAVVDVNTTSVGGENLQMSFEDVAEILQSENWEAPKPNPSGNKLVTDERYAELRERMRKKLGGQMNMGIDPEILAIGTEMAVYHIEKGARKFIDYAKNMIEDLGDMIRPYLKAFYNGARELPEMTDSGLADEMTPYDEVRAFDLSNFGKSSPDAFAAAEQVVKEQEVEQQAEIAAETIKKARPSSNKSKKNDVTSQPESAGLFDEAFAEADNAEIEAQRRFAQTVTSDMLTALDNDVKPYRSILDIRKRASGVGMEVDNDGRSDILLQELVEDGLVRAARTIIGKHGRVSRKSFDLICKLYEMQPTIAARSSNRIKMQQYSTPLPMAWVANRFAMANKSDGKVLEPTAGNGMLVFTVPVEQVHANELDETRLANLREQGFAQVTQHDAVEPFEGGKQYDVVIANPPFGKREAIEYDGKMIGGLDPQITLNALSSMKDDGRAAIIIGGNMEYASNGAIKGMKAFFTYLYDHYNVKGVVDMDGRMYARQGTTFPTRMILIEGRRSEEERAQTAVYPPVEGAAIRKAESFDELYDIIDVLLKSNDKTNGTEILRSQGGRPQPDTDGSRRNTDGAGHNRQPAKDDEGTSRAGGRGRAGLERDSQERQKPVLGERRQDVAVGKTGNRAGTAGEPRNVGGRPEQRAVGNGTQPVDGLDVQPSRLGLKQESKKRGLSEEKLPYRPHNTAFSLESVAPAAMVEAMDNVLTQIEAKHGSIDEFVKNELGYETLSETHLALAAEQMDSVAMAIYQMKQGQALIIGDQTGVGKGRQMAALIRWAVRRGEKPIFITQKADLFSDIYRDLVDIGSGDLVPFIFNSPSAKENKGEMVDVNGNIVYKGLSDAAMKKVMESGVLPDEYDFAVLTYSQVNTGDAVSQQEADNAAKSAGRRAKKSKSAKEGKATPKATFLRSIAENNYIFLDESHTAAGSSNTGMYLQSIIRSAKAVTFASATFAKRPDTMPLYAIRTAMSQAKVEPDKLISIIEKGGVTLQEIMSRELTNAGQMVRRERDMAGVVTDWKTINDPETVRRARENYDSTIAAFNAIIKFQEDYVKPMIANLDAELAVYAESAGVKRGTNKLGVENVPFASKTYNYTKQLMLALKVEAIANEVEAEVKAGRHPVIALESTMESNIKDYTVGEVISEPTFSASLLRGLDTVMQYTVKDENGKERHERYTPSQLGSAGEKAYYELQEFIKQSTTGIFISPLDAIIERLREKGYKVGELTGRDMYVEHDDSGRVVVRKRTDKDKKRMQRDFNSGKLDVLILNKSASTGISLHASEKFSDQRQRSMIIAQPLSDINDYMQMIGRIDRTGQVHRGYYINLGLPVPAENRFLMMLSTKLKSLNANTTTSQDSESNDVEAPDLLNKYGSQVVVEYLRDNIDIYEKMGAPLKKGAQGGGSVSSNDLDEYKAQEDDARRVTGYVALLTTKEQEDFYDDVVRRYNELIKYLNDTGNNDLKITVMPLKAKTIERRVSSEGIDPNGDNPFARNSFVERVEMDVLRKPMKAEEVRKTIEQVNKSMNPDDYRQTIIDTILTEDEARLAAEDRRYEKAKEKAAEDIAKQAEKINRQQKRSEEEKLTAIASYTQETNDKIEEKHSDNIARINANSDQLMRRLRMFSVGRSYLVPENLESMIFDFASPAIFCGYKAKESKITASTTFAVFATLDGRRRVEVKLSQIGALDSIKRTTDLNWDTAQNTTLENWDSQIPNETRKEGYIMTGNILQAIADTQDEYGGYPGQLISYTDIDGNIHDGILMPDKWNASMLKTSGAPLISLLRQIKNFTPVESHDGKVMISGSKWAEMFYLTVPKTKKDGAKFFENKAILKAVHGHGFYPYRGQLRADITIDNIETVVKELSKLGVKVKEEPEQDNNRYRDSEENNSHSFSPSEIAGMETPILHSKGSFKNFNEAEKWARTNLQGKSEINEFTGERISIGRDSVDKMLSKKAHEQSVSIPVHLAALQSVLDFIRTGIPAEIHADKKGGDFDIMRLYNAFETEGVLYRVKSTVKRVRQGDKYYTYEVQEMELIEERQSSWKGEGETPNNPDSSINSITGAKLLKGVKKTNSESLILPEEAENERYRIRENEPPVNTGIGYKVFYLKNGKLYPPMVANPEGADTPTGVWLDADAAPVSGQSKTVRPQVKAGGKGTQGGGGQLSYRPGWHLGEIPYALQFNRLDSETGERELFPKDFVWAEVEYANDVDYQQEAMSYGYTENGNFRHSYAGLPRVPENGAYTYRTNPNPETDPWIITGAMKVNRLLTPTEVDEIVKEAGREPQKRQKGAITDEQIEKLNDEILRRNASTPEGMAEAANRLGDSLGVKVRIVSNANELTSDNASKQKRMRRSKGWFDTDSKEIVIVLPNNHSVADIESTVMHEVVGHMGLRALVGSKNFNDFLDAIFRYVSEDTRRKIVELSKSRNWDTREATEEYIAQLAEAGFKDRESRNIWEMIRDFFADMLSKAKIALGYHLNDNDLRYMLWRSYQMQKSHGAAAVAEDVVMRHKLGIGELRFRDSGPTPTSSGLARSIYEDAVRITNKEGKKTRTANIKHRLRESYQDSMLALKKLQEAIVAETGKTISHNENAYIAENRMSSQNRGQAEVYMRDFYKPLQDAVAELTKQGATYEDIVKYLIAKHGLERNLVFSKRDAEAEGGTWNGSVSEDYSGLTDLTGSKDNFTDLAEDMVNSFESSFNTTDLWSRINAATKETLRKSYESGLMTKETYEKVRDMFQNYIPLRGWDADVAANEYEYLSSSRPKLSPALKAAEGRKSIADDPIATIGYMAESSIIQGNRNLMKQKLLNFVLNNPTSLATVSEQWYVLDAATGNWEARNPKIPEDATAGQVSDIVEQFEADMEALKATKQATKVRDGLKLGKHVTAYEGQEHCIRVKRGGKEFCIYINGNPRAAQAVNGLTNPDASDSSLRRWAQAVKSFMARMFTSKNPAFVITNLCRDVIWAGTAVSVKEDKDYARQYTKNIGGAFIKVKLPVLLYKFKHGTLDMGNETERYFDEFIRNGGETGFTELNTVEDYKRDIERFLKEANANGVAKIPQKTWRGLWNGIEFMNRCAEDTTRFMVYMTSRQMGRSVADSVYDAKEITVNFNKKGSGGFGSSVMNFAYIFFNATIQSLANFGKMLYHHPVKTTMALSTFTMAGMLAPLLAVAMQAMFGDDDENSYWDLPEWVRRNNLVFFVPWSKNGYFTIPLPHELRPFFGMGELAFSCLAGKEEAEDAIGKAVQGFSGLLPLDYTGNAGNIAVNFTPTIAQPFAQIVVNKDYFGKPIYKKNDYNKLDPEWTKVYKGTSALLVNATKWLNDITGGDNVKSGVIDLNPALIEHLFESYLGGVGKTLNKGAKTFSMLWNEDMREWRNVPIASSFYQEAEERTTGSQLNREYFDYKEDHDEIEHRISGYKKQIKMGAMEYAEILNDFMQTPEFKRYVELKGYVNAVSKLNSNLKYADKTQREEIEQRISVIKQMLVDELHKDEE